MSIDIHETQTYSGMTLAAAPARMRELVDLLTSVTPASIYRVDSDTDALYDAIVFVGGDRYARFSASSSGPLVFGVGYMDGDTFTSTDSLGGNIPSISASIAYNNAVTVINDGNVWDVGWRGANGDTARRVHIRAVKLISSINGQATWCAGVYGAAGDAPVNFPDASDQVLIGSAAYGIGASNPSTAANNVPPGKILLFPTLLCTAARIELGTPSIGGQRTYMMSGQSSIPLDAYTEFKVNAARFVSLGYVAIRSE